MRSIGDTEAMGMGIAVVLTGGVEGGIMNRNIEPPPPHEQHILVASGNDELKYEYCSVPNWEQDKIPFARNVSDKSAQGSLCKKTAAFIN